MKANLKTGDEVRVDPNYRVRLKFFPIRNPAKHYLDDVPELPWEKVGGQDQALQAIKDAIELPLLHSELFQSSARDTERFFALWPARLRQDASSAKPRLQSDKTAPGKTATR